MKTTILKRVLIAGAFLLSLASCKDKVTDNTDAMSTDTDTTMVDTTSVSTQMDTTTVNPDTIMGP